jgi:hypothetical protein
MLWLGAILSALVALWTIFAQPTSGKPLVSVEGFEAVKIMAPAILAIAILIVTQWKKGRGLNFKGRDGKLSAVCMICSGVAMVVWIGKIALAY